MNSGNASPPPSPPSPSLPISVGPGCDRYHFSSSPSSSPTPSITPPFPLLSSSPLASSENLPLLTQQSLPTPSSFSLDLQLPQPLLPPATQNNSSSCVKDLFEWMLLRCCRNCPLPI